MNNQEIIEAAYQNAVKDLFAMFFDSLTAANGDEDQERRADERFARGIAIAKNARTRALRLLD